VTLLPKHLNLSVGGYGNLVQASTASSIPSFEVQVVDGNGWIVEAEETLIIEARVSLPSVSGVKVLPHLLGTRRLRCFKGRVVFTDLQIDVPFDAHTLVFVAPGLPMLVTHPFAVYGASHVLLIQQNLQISASSFVTKATNITSGKVFHFQPALLLTNSRVCRGSCAASDSSQDDLSELKSAYNITAYAVQKFPSIRLMVSIKTGTGSRGGRLVGSTEALISPVPPEGGGRDEERSIRFVFTDLGVVGAYAEYVLVFECDGLTWPVIPAESLPFDVLPS
jgi:hypothetical protein